MEVPAHQPVPQWLELVLHQTLGHDVGKLVLSFNLLDVDLSIRVLLSLHVLSEEVAIETLDQGHDFMTGVEKGQVSKKNLQQLLPTSENEIKPIDWLVPVS